MADTRQLHLAVLENGLSLIAVNLPSLWGLLTKTGPERILRSVRSIFSRRPRQSSVTSMGKSRLRSRLFSLSNNEAVSISSSSHVAHLKARSTEIYAMHDIDEESHGTHLPQGQIQITDEITQCAVHV